MHKTAHDGRAALLVALMLVIATIGPAPVTASSATLRAPAGAPAALTHLAGWAGAAHVDERLADRPPVARGFAPIWSFEVRLETRDAIDAAQATADAAKTQAAADAQTAAAKAAAKVATPAYVGRNHLWIPSLGLSRSVSTFACSRSTPPANAVYRWGCAGANNVYLFGHAWGVMKPLHDGFEAGRVKVGMVAKYADASGKVRTYRVTAIRVVTPDQVDWAIAAQSTPSMTLQTCLGANSDHRLLVRLVADR